MNTKIIINAIRRVFISVSLVLLAAQAFAADFSHQTWDKLLQRNVVMIQDGQASRVDYSAFQKNQKVLQAYLASMSAVSRSEFDAWSKDQQLAFLINAYNAWTIEFVLSAYPDIKSIKDLGSFFSSPWKKEFINLLGETRSLDNIEHTLIRGSGRYNEPRIHFAVNCASIGCPALLNRAYTAEKLDAQLELVTRNFLSDRTRNYYLNAELHVSPIFDWYKKDFEQGWSGINSVSNFLGRYADALDLGKTGPVIIVNGKSVSEHLRDGSLGIAYTDYDWSLNDIAKQ